MEINKQVLIEFAKWMVEMKFVVTELNIENIIDMYLLEKIDEIYKPNDS